MAFVLAQLDTLPVVSDPAVPAANDMRNSMTTLGELIAAIADEADRAEISQSEADLMVVEAVFGLQWSLRRVRPPVRVAEPGFAA